MILTLVSKPGCHLCEDMREVVEAVLPGFGATLQEVDVRSDPRLARYLWEIPVLLLGGEELFRHRVEEAELRQRLATLRGASPGSMGG